MAKIKPLPQTLINQIAAGEVVERPASVVKEILENALDAQAKKIHIDIEGAGDKLIRLSDDGTGIDKDDLALAFTAHATSKIATLEDFEHVATLGFRGEALASIASVSKTTLTSRTAHEAHGWKIIPYQDMAISPSPHQQGTTIEIRDLFYNVPARKKFLKSERTERNHIIQVIERIALSKEDVWISLNLNGKHYHDYGGKTHEASVMSVMGEEMLSQSLYIDEHNADMRLYGWIAFPTYNHVSNDKQHFFINGRMVRDKLIAHAIKQSYQDQLYSGRHPIFVLFLEIAPDWVDINIHPSKQEVRFRESRAVYDFLYASIYRTLQAVRPHHLMSHTPSVLEANIAPDFVSDTPSSAHPSSTPTTLSSATKSERYFSQTGGFSTRLPSAISSSSPKATEAYYQLAERAQTAPKQGELLSPEQYPLGQALGQIHRIFILAENAQGLVIVDMHAAHERILYEKLKAQFHANDLPAQQLLVPLPLDIDEGKEQILEEQEAALHRLGFFWRKTEDSLKLTAVPALLKHLDCVQIFCDMLTEIEHFSASQHIERSHNEILATIACHRAVRAHDRLSLAEMNQLLRDLEQTAGANQCNHGRPTWVQLDEATLDSFFMRGQ